MSLIELGLKRRPIAHSFHPSVELLEERQCLSISAPTGLQLTALSATQVKLNWNDVAGETGYRIFRWDGSKTIQVGTVNANVKTFTVSQLQPNQVQWFAVEAYNFAASARTAWASISTPPEKITAPTNLRVVSATTTEITLAWKASTNATGYRVFQWNGTSGVQIGSTPAAVPAFKVTNLTPGTVYYFYVQAYNNTNTASSDWLNATTSAPGITAPANLVAQPVNANTIGLSWKDVASETGYRVYVWNGVTGSNPVLIATLAANTTGYQASGLAPGKTFWFYIQAFNGSNFANTGWVTSATTGAALTAPTQVVATAVAPTTIRVSWTEPATAVGYRVFIWNGYGWTLVSTVAKGTNNSLVSGLASNRTYWFLVQAFTDGFAEVANSDYAFANL